MTLPAPLIRADMTAVCGLDLVSCNPQVDMPEIKDVCDYLVSVANPARDLGMMKVTYVSQIPYTLLPVAPL